MDPGTFSNLLRRKERLEDMRQIVFGDPGACVRYCDGYMGFVSMIMTLDVKIPTLQHGIDGIEDQVDDALLQLIGISLNRW